MLHECTDTQAEKRRFEKFASDQESNAIVLLIFHPIFPDLNHDLVSRSYLLHFVPERSIKKDTQTHTLSPSVQLQHDYRFLVLAVDRTSAPLIVLRYATRM